jgi:hypothetical protein
VSSKAPPRNHGGCPGPVELENCSDGSLVGVRIASAKTTVPHAGGQRSRHDQENRERPANARGERAERGTGRPRRPDADGHGDHAPRPARLGPCARAAALNELFGAEAVALAGPKGRHQPQRTHHHWGTAATELTFGGRRVQVRRPRVRQTIGGEATLPSVAAFRDRDPLTTRMMQQLLAGCRRATTRAVWRRGRAGGPAEAVARVRSVGPSCGGLGSGCKNTWRVLRPQA